MIIYLIKSSFILAIILAVYHVFLSSQKTHQLNRGFLLTGLIIAIFSPLITLGGIDSPFIQYSFESISAPLIAKQSQIAKDISIRMDWFTIGYALYLFVSAFMLLRFIGNFGSLLHKIKIYPRAEYKGFPLILVKESVLPHTFLGYIFINETDYSTNNYDKELLSHEIAHSKQWHSVDIIFIELVQIIFWFNPFIYFYKKALKLNHEFLADEFVINTHGRITKYQNLLIEASASKISVPLASNLNYSVTKKRLVMMTKPKPKNKNIIYGIFFIPFFLFIISCSGNYNYERCSTAPVVIEKGDFIMVDFRGMDHEDLELAKEKLETHDIIINYDEIEFDDQNNLIKFKVLADFGNGSTGTGSFNCNELKVPFGLWVNSATGENGIGPINHPEINKQLLQSRLQELNEMDTDFFIENNKVTYVQASKWLESVDRWQSHAVCTDKTKGKYTMTLTEL